MIITLKGANFSTNKIGTLSNWTILPVIDSGTVYSGVRSVKKGDPFTATLTLQDNYAYSNGVEVTMGGGGTITKTESGKVTTISTTSTTGNITIKALTYNTSTGGSGSGGETTKYTITYKYMSGSTTIKTQFTEQVTAGTTKTFSTAGAPSVSGYTCSSVSPSGQQTINSDITVTYNYTADVVVPAGSTIFDLDFTTKTLDDYVTEGIITIPSTSKTDELVYDTKGLTTNKTGTAAQLLNGAKLTNTFDIARDWTFEITMTIDPWQEDFGMTEALYNNFMFVTAAEHEMPLEDGKNHGSNCFTPAIYDNGGTFTGRFPTNGNVGISGASKTITADGIEHTYKWVHTESDQNNAFYKDGTKEKDTKWTNTSYTFGGQFGYILGAHSGYSSASNFCLKKGFHIKSMKLYTN